MFANDDNLPGPIGVAGSFLPIGNDAWMAAAAAHAANSLRAGSARDDSPAARAGSLPGALGGQAASSWFAQNQAGLASGRAGASWPSLLYPNQTREGGAGGAGSGVGGASTLAHYILSQQRPQQLRAGEGGGLSVGDGPSGGPTGEGDTWPAASSPAEAQGVRVSAALPTMQPMTSGYLASGANSASTSPTDAAGVSPDGSANSANLAGPSAEAAEKLRHAGTMAPEAMVAAVVAAARAGQQLPAGVSNDDLPAVFANWQHMLIMQQQQQWGAQQAQAQAQQQQQQQQQQQAQGGASPRRQGKRAVPQKERQPRKQRKGKGDLVGGVGAPGPSGGFGAEWLAGESSLLNEQFAAASGGVTPSLLGHIGRGASQSSDGPPADELVQELIDSLFSERMSPPHGQRISSPHGQSTLNAALGSVLSRLGQSGGSNSSASSPGFTRRSFGGATSDGLPANRALAEQGVVCTYDGPVPCRAPSMADGAPAAEQTMPAPPASPILRPSAAPASPSPAPLLDAADADAGAPAVVSASAARTGDSDESSASRLSTSDLLRMGDDLDF